MINKPNIEYYSVEYWEENWEELFERVEQGETIGVKNTNGDKAIMLPADNELIEMYRDLNNEGP
jgi:hypothetical protein